MSTFGGDLELLLLTLLEGGERYGLELSKELRAMTEGDVDLNAGTLYPALHRMEKRGWLSSDNRPSPRGGHPLRYYILTDQGKRALNDKRDSYRKWHRGLTERWGTE
ncbi:PadR family transcriptional regulator [Deinococcus petrolearius]|uniref:PadR family transcriptional regulator n=1 Tax=Deinococcus petrolearius TaxID=1751295 RepID=A0ABW1DM72_9DEIO